MAEARSRGLAAHGYDIYMDGVPTTRRDGVFGVWVRLLVSDKRHLCVVMQKSRLCRCGCRGWCTFFPIFHWLGCCCKAMGNGKFLDARPDGQPWLPSDSERLIRVGLQLAFIGACIYIKGDWAEFAFTMALASWAEVANPCFECFSLMSTWMNDYALDVTEYPFQLTTPADYDASCTACEHMVTVSSRAMHSHLSRLLAYDRRDDHRGSHGRALTADVDALGLKWGDRLEPFELLQDVGLGFDELEPSAERPVQLLFWRPSSASRAKHRNPLFSAGTGITIHSLLEEFMHCFHLGVLKDFLTQLVWELLLSDAFRVTRRADRPPNQQEILEEGCELLRAGLLTWYSRQPARSFTQFQEFSLKMIGTPHARCLKAKAAELKGLLFYFECLLSVEDYVCSRIANGGIWLRAARALKQILETLKATPMRVPVDVQQQVINMWMSYRRLADRLELKLFPKTHLLGHAFFRCDLF